MRIFRSRLLSDGNVVSIGNADKIQQPGDDQKLGPVIGSGVSNRAMSPILYAGDNIKRAASNIPDESENVQNVASIRMVDASLHQQAENEHGADGGHEQRAANPALLD